MAMGMITKVSSNRRSYRKSKKLATVKQVKNLISRNVEKNEQKITVAGGTVVTAGAIYDLWAGNITKDSKIDELSLRFTLTNVTNANQLVRVIIFQYKQSSSQVAPTVGNILDTASPLAQYTENTKQTYAHILSDRSYTMNLFDKSLIAVNIPYFKRVLHYKNNATSGLDLNELYMLVIGTVNTNTTLSSMYVDVKYHEID